MNNHFIKSTEIEPQPKKSGIEVWRSWTKRLHHSILTAESAARITALKRGAAVHNPDQGDKKWENLFSRVSEGMSKTNNLIQG